MFFFFEIRGIFYMTTVVFMLQLYMYQLFRSLAYIHSLGICHRDIKPQNLLLDPDSGVLKLCDFGSAKHLVKGEPNVSYICSRYYRAPELIFGAIDYTTKIGKRPRIFCVDFHSFASASSPQLFRKNRTHLKLGQNVITLQAN